ncbi:forkhead box protein N5-like isoform 1-T1 [Rhinophrynus dorsalis]
MYLRFANREPYERLHLSTALEDWDMMEELKLSVTIDQYFAGAEDKVERYTLRCQHSTESSPARSEEGDSQECSFRPSLWLVVDPNLVIPCPEGVSRTPPEPHRTPSSSESQTPPSIDYSTMDDSEDEGPTSYSELCSEDEDVFHPCRPPANHKKVKCPRKKGRVQRGLTQLDSWPRPPINYCNLISLALRNSEEGSLNVQQIYSFVREHFPFFRVAPDGWKNTVRHNLCFSSSFEKSSGWVCADGHRRSCLWKLTRQGRRKFRAEMHSLSDELLRVLRRSMNKPDGRFPPDLLEQVQALERHGVEAAESGDAGTAIERFSEAISLLPERASAYNNRAQALRLQGDVTGALLDLNLAVELSGGKGVAGRQALVQRGLILRLQGEDEAARKDMERAAQQGSEFAKQQLVLLNPYSALCNSMLRDMVQKLHGPDPQGC